MANSIDHRRTGVRLFIFKLRYFKYTIITEEPGRLLFIYTYNTLTLVVTISWKFITSIFLHCLLSGRNSVTSEKKKKLTKIERSRFIFFFEFQDERLKLGDDKALSEHLKLPIQRINDYQLLVKVSRNTFPK